MPIGKTRQTLSAPDDSGDLTSLPPDGENRPLAKSRLNFPFNLGLRMTSFALVGATGIAINSLALFLLTDVVGFHYLVSAVLATQFSTAWNFSLYETWVFSDRNQKETRLGRLIQFLIMNNATLVIKAPLLFLLTSWLGVHYLVSNVLVILMIALARFTVADRWIWSARPKEQIQSYFYKIHNITSVQSSVHLPELEPFRVNEVIDSPDLIIKTEEPQIAFSSNTPSICYKEGVGPFSFKVRVFLDSSIHVYVSSLVGASPHVLYTNVVEPIMRWTLIRKGYALVHGACVSSGRQAVLISARTDTGKTTTILRLLRHSSFNFLSDDMILMSSDGELYSYPKPLTISSHTLNAVGKAGLTFFQRAALQIQSRVHSKSGRRFAHALAKIGIPVASVNAIAQILIPPPKYEIQRLIPNVSTRDNAKLSHIVFIESGDRGEYRLTEMDALSTILANSEDAYGFPPYSEITALLLGAFDQDLRHMESKIIESAIRSKPTLLLRRERRDWWQRFPTIFEDLKNEPLASPNPDISILGKGVTLS